MTTRILGLHAGYTCAHSGRCCTSGWPIPLEPSALSIVDARIADGALRATAADVAAVITTAQGTVLGTHEGRCVFYDGSTSGGCRIHTACGADAQPVACQQFPRHVVRDPRGVSIALSFVCPTAARRAFARPDALTIITNDAAFPPEHTYIGLDATTALPPAIRTTWLLDWETWWTIEAQAVAWLADDPRLALPRLRTLLGQLAAHATPTLDECRHAMLDIEARPLDAWVFSPEDGRRVADALGQTVPSTWQAEATNALRAGDHAVVSVPDWTVVVASHAFASWPAYGGASLWSWLVALEDVARLFEWTGRAEGVDLVVRHLADSSALIEHWNREARRRYSSDMNGYL